MRSITTWNRLEPLVAGRDPDIALQARVHDPAWLLARQWQLGELTGEDAGSPAWARLRATSTRLSAYRPGADGPAAALAPDAPLEPLVEAEAPSPDWRLAAEAGAHLRAALEAAGLARLYPAIAAAYPLPDPAPGALDPAGARILRLLRRRSFDGAALLRAVGRPAALPERPAVPAPDRDALLAVLERWAAWYPQPPGAGRAWRAERFEYQLAAAAGTTTLEAPDYQGGRLDWQCFRAAESLDLGADEPPEHVVATALPARVTFPGMPANRWWELEDARVWLGGVEAEAGDVARMLLVEFATVFGNDWFLAPLELRYGTLTELDALVVTDTFGQATLLRPTELARAAPGAWRMFQVSGAPVGSLLLAPVVADGLEGPAIEELLLARDETANMAFAIERAVTGPAGNTIDRHERWRARLADAEPAAATPGVLRYEVARDVPDHWIPLVPRAESRRSIRLERATFVTADGRELAPQGRLLEPEHELAIPEEEVPRSGLLVTRAWQLARDPSGASHLWVGRRARPGRGPGASGLAFDVLEPPAG